MRKIIGAVFFFFAILTIIPLFGSDIPDNITGLYATLGYITGTFLGIAFYLIAGIYFFIEVRFTAENYESAAKKRSGLNIIATILTVFSALMFLVSVFYTSRSSSYNTSISEALTSYLIKVIPFFIFFFILFLESYSKIKPRSGCKKAFGKTNFENAQLIKDGGELVEAEGATDFLVNRTALVHKRSLAVIPVAEILWVNERADFGIEKYIVFATKNKKDVQILSWKYKEIESFINRHPEIFTSIVDDKKQ